MDAVMGLVVKIISFKLAARRKWCQRNPISRINVMFCRTTDKLKLNVSCGYNKNSVLLLQ